MLIDYWCQCSLCTVTPLACTVHVSNLSTTHLGDVNSWLALPKDPASMIHSSNDTQPKDTNTAVQDHSLWVLGKVSEGEHKQEKSLIVFGKHGKAATTILLPKRERERGCSFAVSEWEQTQQSEE